ncbi:hypothetical protein Tco_0212305 [Tanacetum coccineum]
MTEIQQAVARDKKWVPFSKRVKISSANIILETTAPQKEETFQVVIDLIKNSTCLKDFTISTDVLEIFMQQFWYSIKKLLDTNSYELLLSNKKCVVNADVFKTILDICLRVEGVDFTDVLDDDTALTFLIKLGYKGPLENVDYPELIWEDLAYQIDHKKEKRSRRENMPYPGFTQIIINHFLKQHMSLSNLKCQHYHSIKDDGILCRLKFVRIREDYQEYGLPIPDVMLTDVIKQSKSYQMFIKYSTGQIPPKKSRGKGSQGKKTTDTPVTDIDVSEEYEPEPAKKKTSSKRRVKKKVTMSTDDNIISDDPDVALELGKVTPDPFKKLKIVPSLTPKEQEVVDTMKALKKRKKTSRRQPGTGGSNKGTGSIPGVPNESIIVSATSSEGTNDKPGVPDEEKVTTEEKVILEWEEKQGSKYSDDEVDKDDDVDDEGDEHISDTQDADDEYAETKSDEDDIYKYKICVRTDEDEEMTNTEVEGSDKGDKEVTDAAKTYAEKTLEVKHDAKKTELPSSSSSLSVSLGFGDQFLKTSFDTSLIVPHIQSPSILRVPVSMISEPSVLTPIQENPSTTPITTLPPPSVSPTPPLRVAKLEKDVSELKKIDLSAEAITDLKTQVSTVVDDYLGSKVRDVFQKELQKHIVDLIQKYYLTQASENPANHRLYHALMEALIKDENAMDKGVADTGKMMKRRRTKESVSSKKPSATKETPKGKALSKGSKTGKSASVKEPVEEPIAEVVMDDVGEDVVRDDNQPQLAS